MVLLCSFDAALGAAPRHHDGILRESSGEDLVPSDDAASARGEELLDLVVEVGLQLVLGTLAVLTASASGSIVLRVAGESQFLDLSLALRALLPAFLGAFVATDVDEWRGEDVAELAKDGLQEGERLGVAAAEHIAHHTPVGGNGVGASQTSEVGEDVEG